MKIAAIGLQSRVVQIKGNVASDMNGEKVMFSIEKGKYYNLGAIGGAIWDAIDQPLEVAELIQKLTLEYDVEPSECEKHVLSFLEMLLRENLIELLS